LCDRVGNLTFWRTQSPIKVEALSRPRKERKKAYLAETAQTCPPL
jgi:hypothetical protein